MFCSKCGSENNEDSLFCNKCGNKLNSDITTNSGNNDTYGLICKKNMFAGFLLNIIAFALPILMVVFSLFANSTSSESKSSGGVRISISMPNTDITIVVIIGIFIFGLGMAIYFIKNKKSQRIMSIIYLISAIVDLTLCVMTCLRLVFATCGLGVMIFIPGILQIIAGTKFISATRFNKI